MIDGPGGDCYMKGCGGRGRCTRTVSIETADVVRSLSHGSLTQLFTKTRLQHATIALMLVQDQGMLGQLKL